LASVIIQEMPIGTCPALRRDGKPCGARASSSAATYCGFHEEMVERFGEQAVLEGSYPKVNRRALAFADEDPAVVDEDATPTEVAEEPVSQNGNGRRTPRSWLGEASTRSRSGGEPRQDRARSHRDGDCRRPTGLRIDRLQALWP
jgi:hypothetical protein